MLLYPEFLYIYWETFLGEGSVVNAAILSNLETYLGEGSVVNAAILSSLETYLRRRKCGECCYSEFLYIYWETYLGEGGVVNAAILSFYI